jgi:hypothetical protein
MISPSALDLTTLPSVRSWIGGLNNGSTQVPTDSNLQACITAFSIEFLRLTGRGPMNWQLAGGESPFVQPIDYAEQYSGNGNPKLMLRNFPVNSIASVLVGSMSLTASTGTGQAGYAVGADGRSVVILAGGAASPDTFFAYPMGQYGSWRRGGFPYGNQNITVSYNAGFSLRQVRNELQTVLKAWQASTLYQTGDVVVGGGFIQTATNSGTSGANAPTWNANSAPTTDDDGVTWSTDYIPATANTILAGSIVAGFNWLADVGVSYFSDGTTLTPVQTSPQQGQYFVQNGLYLFNAADAGTEMLLSYNASGTPADIVLAANQSVALNYRRRDWVGVRSVAMKDVGSTSYTTWAMDESVRNVIANYTRRSI